MADTPAISKIEDAAREVLAAWPELSDWTVRTETSADIALAKEDGDAITIYTANWQVDDDTEQGQQVHTAILAFETAARATLTASIDRNSQIAFAQIVAALHASGYLGGMVENIEPLDAGTVQNGRDVGGASLHVRFKFYTPLNDWFAIVGATGTF